MFQIHFNIIQRRLPWWLSDKESTCQCRSPRFDPWSRKIPHAMWQLSPWATTPEPVLQSPRAITPEARDLEPHALQQRSHRDEKPMHCNQREQPRSLLLEKALPLQQRPNRAKKIKKERKKERKHTFKIIKIYSSVYSMNCFNVATIFIITMITFSLEK